MRNRELDDIHAVCLRARDDSMRIAGKIPAVLQSFGKAVKSINSMIAVKEKELADLRLKRDSAKQDSSRERRRQNEILAAAEAPAQGAAAFSPGEIA